MERTSSDVCFDRLVEQATGVSSMSEDAITRMLSEGYLNEAMLLGASEADLAAAFLQKPALHMIVLGDSLSLPRPYIYENYTAANPFLATRFHQTYPVLLVDRLEITSGKIVRLTNGCRRGLLWDEYALGAGRGVVEMLTSYEADYFISLWGYSELWRFKESDDGLEACLQIARRYSDLIETVAQRMPFLKIAVIALPMPGRELADRYPRMSGHIRAFNQHLRDHKAASVAFVEVKLSENLLHTDQQHFSTAGHIQVANAIEDALSATSTV